MSKKIMYDANFKTQVVIQSLNPNTTIEAVRVKYGLSKNAIASWRKIFMANAHKAFEPGVKTNTGVSTDELKKIIGDLTVENSILKKISKLMS